MAPRSEGGPTRPALAHAADRDGDADLMGLDDEALVAAVAQALAQTGPRRGLDGLDPAALLAEARRLLAHWDAQLYGACCTEEAAYDDLRRDLTDIAHVADVLLVDALTDALTAASQLPRSVTRLVAVFVLKHGFDAGRGLACPAWARFVALAAEVTPATP